ncbi:hypothetical protein HELRODRAFT_170295 [Helobdella robusta]|uniref:Membrane insertase YidC/Oxa/ALB C-terminal domain-containing protein n=1 Tax=Helobdella robusta TaxID=6412 RepID=T1F2W2_HELRO|nr:hypothetical protein HELRODRAFT_170295 [Helobdella robusta]ESO07747.1 hypothetical protein HELRODRAFT_170295 [Helobdella robusta]
MAKKNMSAIFQKKVFKVSDKFYNYKLRSQVVVTRKISQSFYDTCLSLDAPPIKAAYIFLDSIHNYTGLPWWASILSATFILRTTLTLPIFIITAKNNEKLVKLSPKVKKLSDELKIEISRAQKEFKWDAKMALHHYRWNMKRIVKDLYVKENCHPAKNFILPWIQLPIWISTSLSLRNMSGMFQVDGNVIPAHCPELSIEGMLWFQNLLLPDMIFLPLIMLLSNTLILEFHNRRIKNHTKLSKTITYVMRGINIIMVPIAATVPSCLSFYWACSSIYGLLQNIIMSSIMKGKFNTEPPASTDDKIEQFKNLKDKK